MENPSINGYFGVFRGTPPYPPHFRQPPRPLHSYSKFGIAIFQKRGLEADDLPFFFPRPNCVSNPCKTTIYIYIYIHTYIYIYMYIIIIYKDIEIDIDIDIDI